jgi:hypothetical protein
MMGRFAGGRLRGFVGRQLEVPWLTLPEKVFANQSTAMADAAGHESGMRMAPARRPLRFLAVGLARLQARPDRIHTSGEILFAQQPAAEHDVC